MPRNAPFQVGEKVDRHQLSSWQYTGLSGKPGKDTRPVRRFRKGDWILELFAHVDPARVSRVVAIRTTEEDDAHWTETRQRLIRHRSN